eukprot:2151120-Amphidinium_carterae.1
MAAPEDSSMYRKRTSSHLLPKWPSQPEPKGAFQFLLGTSCIRCSWRHLSFGGDASKATVVQPGCSVLHRLSDKSLMWLFPL